MLRDDDRLAPTSAPRRRAEEPEVSLQPGEAERTPSSPAKPPEDLAPSRKDGSEHAPDPDKQAREAEKGESENKTDGSSDEPGGLRPFIRRHPLALAGSAVVLVAAIVAGVLWYLAARHFETTDDAFIDGRAFSLAPKVGGYVTAVLVTDNQHVTAGETLARIDERDYRVAIDQAEAQVAVAAANVKTYDAQLVSQDSQIQQAKAQLDQANASLDFAKLEFQRAKDLMQKGAGTVQKEQQTTSDLDQGQSNVSKAKAALESTIRQIDVLKAQRSGAEASLAQARAQLEQARLNLAYTNVTAEQNGRIVRLSAGKGQLAQAGTALAMFVPDEMWVTANFKETQLTDMRPNQPVSMWIDAYPDKEIRGHVASIQPGSGTVFSLLPAQNATGNYVKVVQRVPVKLVFDEVPPDVTIGPGMSVVPKVKVR